jgi:CTP:molybdopterin cytidylyltransferase MocA
LAIITRVDEPRPAAVYARLLDAHTPTTFVTRLAFEGERGTPIVVNERALEALRNVRDAETIAQLVESADANEVPFDTDIVLLRVASLDDCRRARERYAL